MFEAMFICGPDVCFHLTNILLDADLKLAKRSSAILILQNASTMFTKPIMKTHILCIIQFCVAGQKFIDPGNKFLRNLTSRLARIPPVLRELYAHLHAIVVLCRTVSTFHIILLITPGAAIYTGTTVSTRG